MTHTPTPWFHVGCSIGNTTSSSGHIVAETSAAAVGLSVAKENAEFIVRAVNAHDSMLAALRGLRAVVQLVDELGAQVNKAIAIAEGKP